MEYLSALNPNGLLRSVSAMGSEFGRRVWNSAPPPQRPFRVCDHKRTIRKGLTAATRQELLDKVLETLLLSGVLTLVLEEDGTAVESEDFFQMLEDDTCLMVLEKGQSWSPKSGMLSYGLGREKPKHSKDIVRITFDVYKQNPRDLFGSLNVKATFYGLYSMSCDFQGVGPKKVLRELLRWTSSLLQGMGHMLLGISSTLRHIVEGLSDGSGSDRVTSIKNEESALSLCPKAGSMQHCEACKGVVRFGVCGTLGNSPDLVTEPIHTLPWSSSLYIFLKNAVYLTYIPAFHLPRSTTTSSPGILTHRNCCYI